MTVKSADEAEALPDMDTTCELLDKLVLKQLHLMEDKMRAEVNIEANLNNGTIHLAKSRYIMGQSSVSATRLPLDTSPEFSASTLCASTEEDGVTQLKVVESDAENTVNPLRWFGVLVPQNLHKAQSIFQNTINYVIECANIQLQLTSNLENIELLKKFKSSLGVGSVE
ncbi:unnamed protein product [Plutella xylostella]|uniref:Vacuolar ATPase assembly protein VMA22 n=1 Tax=Plutella xylostella TaxID=51655 RepID=A0A8S4EA77_PLUXY|nr:coiled-coil domain-containing protein 115 [Plutella xylostella]CAG9112718.1 unnamed protein product [Plutella xylostella]